MVAVENMKNRKIIVFTLIIIISAIPIICFNFYDCIDIAQWALNFLNCTVEGNIRNFAIYCYELGQTVNYGAFINIICAAWCIPIYIIDSLTAVNISIVIYCVWLKTGIFIVNFFIANVLFNILDKMEVKVDRSKVFILWFPLALCSLQVWERDR